MKAVLGIFFLLFSFGHAFATIDANDRAYIVAKNIQSDEFFVERVPIIGCYGLAMGPQLVQFTLEYKATANIGCGGEPRYENINQLTCARVIKALESDDFLTFKEIWLDITDCADKNIPNFIATIKSAARLNFPQKTGKLKLVLIKESK